MAHTFLIMVTYTYTICGLRMYVHNGLNPSRFSLLQRHSIFVWSTNCNKYIKCNQNTLVKISWALGENSFFLPPLVSCLSNKVNQKFNLIYILMKIKGPYEVYRYRRYSFDNLYCIKYIENHCLMSNVVHFLSLSDMSLATAELTRLGWWCIVVV